MLKDLDVHCQLFVVVSDHDRATCHRIRRAEIFEKLLPGVPYRPNDPEHELPSNFNLLLKADGVGIGTTRLDVRAGGIGIMRLVAIDSLSQGQGHGRTLTELVEEFARARGVTKVLLNALPTSVGFYTKHGYVPEVWDPSETVGPYKDEVQMSKVL